MCVVAANGSVYSAGDAEVEFTIMSVAKPFDFALVCESVGPDEVREKVRANGARQPFNSLAAIEQSGDGRTNPMVNPGAIATTSLVPGTSAADKWEPIQAGLSRFAGRTLSLDDEVYWAASETNDRNQSIARLLRISGRIYSDPSETLDLYTRQSSLSVSAKDLGVMGATLADGGVNPLTAERVVGEETCRHTLAVMTTGTVRDVRRLALRHRPAGKERHRRRHRHGRSRKGGLGTFAPPLDGAGDSVKGQLVARFLSRRLGLNLFRSKPEL